jgi:hypothetical protein
LLATVAKFLEARDFLINRAYAALSWLAIGLGVIHLMATPHYSAQLTQAGLWFASGGLVMILTGTLNLLNRAYGRAAAGLRRVSVAMNFAMTAFGVLMGIAGHPTLFQFAVVVGIFGGLTVSSLLRPALLPRSAG